MLKVEYSDALMYKERTHRDDGRGWTPSDTTARFYKRQAAKVSRRNGQVVVEEWEVLDIELSDLMHLWVAYVMFLQDWAFTLDLRDLMGYGPQATHNCHCATCVKIKFGSQARRPRSV